MEERTKLSANDAFALSGAHPARPLLISIGQPERSPNFTRLELVKVGLDDFRVAQAPGGAGRPGGFSRTGSIGPFFSFSDALHPSTSAGT
jgi:hypothetical protein